MTSMTPCSPSNVLSSSTQRRLSVCWWVSQVSSGILFVLWVGILAKCETRSGLLGFGQSCDTFRRKSKGYISRGRTWETDSDCHLVAAKTWLDKKWYAHVQWLGNTKRCAKTTRSLNFWALESLAVAESISGVRPSQLANQLSSMPTLGIAGMSGARCSHISITTNNIDILSPNIALAQRMCAKAHVSMRLAIDAPLLSTWLLLFVGRRIWTVSVFWTYQWLSLASTHACGGHVWVLSICRTWLDNLHIQHYLSLIRLLFSMGRRRLWWWSWSSEQSHVSTCN